MSAYESRLLREATKRIADHLTRLHKELGNGSLVVGNDPGATGLRCVRHIGEIAGLEAAIILIQGVEDDFSGRTERKKQD